jgi:DNA-binding LacI/PurR family transcriptional regulator
MATIRDIARLSGFGVGTVSRVINGGRGVDPATNAAILATAARLGYRPDRAARALSRRKTAATTIGVALPSVVHPFYFEILKGIHAGLSGSGYNLVLFDTGMARADTLERIIAEHPAGLLVVAEGLTDEEKRLFRANDLPFVYVEYGEPDVPSVSIDNRLGGRLAAQALLARGVCHPAWIGENVDSRQHQERFAGFNETLAQGGLAPAFNGRVPMDDCESENLAAELLANGIADGFACFCDRLACGVLRAVRSRGLPVPVIGYDDLEAARWLGLSTIRQPAALAGQQGLRLLLECIAGRPAESILLAPELVLRES